MSKRSFNLNRAQVVDENFLAMLRGLAEGQHAAPPGTPLNPPLVRGEAGMYKAIGRGADGVGERLAGSDGLSAVGDAAPFDGEDNSKRRALTHRAFEFDLTLEFGNDFHRGGQPKPRTALTFR